MASSRPRSRTRTDEDRVVENMPPVGYRSLMESGMRSKTTIVDRIIVVLFLIALVAILLQFLPGFFGHR